MSYAKHMPADSQRLARAVTRLSRRLRQERKSDLTVAQLSVLTSVIELDGATPSQIAARERVSQPSITRTLNCLIEDAYVNKTPHPDDGRQVVITISELGVKVLAAERQRRDRWLDDRLATLEAADIATLREAIPLIEHLAEAQQ